MLGACLGLAKPKEEFEESESSDEDNYGGRASKAATMEEKKKKNKKRSVSWFRRQERATGPIGFPSKNKEGTKVRYANRTDLTLTMMSTVVQIPRVHTIEIIKCHLNKIPPSIGECDFLEVLALPHNKISDFDQDMGKCPKLRQLILDFNNICEINSGIFSRSTFNKLEVIGLAHNWLTYVPADFGITSTPNLLKRLDLSYNQLQSIPNSITDAKLLEDLNLSHNCLVSLPKEFKHFQQLERLFLSFNQLTELPDDIGHCKELRKVRIVTNKIRKLPDSMIWLWKKPSANSDSRVSANTGLEELLVDDNPLEMPSITAFEMDGGGIDRAFALFDEYLQKRRESAPTRRDSEVEDGKEEGEDQPPPPGEAPGVELADVEVRKQSPSSEFYFGHCKDSEEIGKIQTAQSTLLVIKRNTYIEAQRKVALAKRREAAARGGGASVPPSLEIFLRDDYKTAFHGLVPVTDLDVYFSLLVFTMKPGFASVYTLWTKYEDGDKGHMTRQEWNEFCMCVPISMSDGIRDQMYHFMAYHGNEIIWQNDFVAAWQLHDIVEKDPWIDRITKVLRLDYYDMEVRELQSRLRAKDANTATPQLDFNNPDADRDNAAVELSTQGVQVYGSMLQSKAAARAPVDGAVVQRELLQKVSLDDEEYDACAAADSSEDTSSDDSANSCELSESTCSEASEFDAQEFLKQREKLLNQSKASAQKKHVVDSDASLRQLMEIPVADFWRRAGLGRRTSEPMAKQRAAKKKAPKPVQRDVNGSTIGVRRVIREVRRSMPHDDFCSLINFITRWLTLIKSSTGTPAMTYWHEDDPIFRHVMGSGAANRYTRKLLMDMGFAKLNGTYWVWPAYHLDAGSLAPSWGDSAVPPDCPGRDPARLDEMLSVLKCCQMQMNKHGTEFTGHVRRNKALGNLI